MFLHVFSGGLKTGPCSFRLLKRDRGRSRPYAHGRDMPDALCHWDWRGGRRVGSAVPLGVHSVAELSAAWCSVA